MPDAPSAGAKAALQPCDTSVEAVGASTVCASDATCEDSSRSDVQAAGACDDHAEQAEKPLPASLAAKALTVIIDGTGRLTRYVRCLHMCRLEQCFYAKEVSFGDLMVLSGGRW